MSEQTQQKKHSKRVRLTLSLLTLAFAAVIVLPAAISPKEAKAFPGEALAAAVWSFTKTKINDALKTARKTASDLAFKNALKVYLTKFAEDTAVWLASAGTGQKPLFVTDPHYWTNLTDAAAGDFLDTIGTEAFGVDVCAPANIRQQYSVESAVRALVDPENFCSNQCNREYQKALNTDLLTIGEREFAAGATMTLPQAEQTLRQLQSMINQNPNCLATSEEPNRPFDPIRCPAPADVCPNDGSVPVALGTCIEAYSRDVTRYKQATEQNNRLCLNLCSAKKRVARCTASDIFEEGGLIGSVRRQIENKEFLPKFSLYFEPGENDIGQLLTLAEKARQIQADALLQDSAINKGIQPQTDPITGEVRTPAELTRGAAVEGLTTDPSGQAYQVYTGSPIADAIGVFTNTLTKRLLKRIFEQGFNPNSGGGTQLVGGRLLTGLTGGVQAARTLFASLAQPEFTSGGSSVSLAELSACPETGAGPNNCIIDEGFRQAIEQQLTVKEALEQGLLNPNWPFGYQHIGEGRNDDVEPDFRSGYPYRSMLVLRRLRIIPIGWELAAQYQKDFGSQPASLGEVVDEYDDCIIGQLYSSFCGLVDPNWVLKAPQTFCEVSGASAQLTSLDYAPDPLFPDAPQIQQIGRADVCADEQSCLEEDENGNCLAYGYCVKERPSWKFGGDKCTPANHSCETFTTASNTQVSYLANSVDYEGCTADNAGCQWYCADYNVDSGAFECTNQAFDQGGKSKLYFTAKVESCPPEAEGCNEYIRTTNGSNLIKNGGFEILPEAGVVDDGNPDIFPGWENAGVTTSAVSDVNGGAAAAEVAGGAGNELRSTFDTGFPLDGQSYTLSFYAKVASTCTASFGLRSLAGGSPYVKTEPVDYASNWQRYTTTIEYDPALDYNNSQIVTFFDMGNCGSILIDEVQLENSESFSSYKEYGSENKIYLSKDRVSCTEEEVGCNLYTSSTDQIPGVVTSSDFCPAEAVGCRAFLEVPVTDNGTDVSHPERTGLRCSGDQTVSCNLNASDGDECSGIGSCLPSVSLTPVSGTQCSAAYVGCEEYTNLDVVAQGGEGKEYYTQIRECVKPPDNQKTFYTWVGSEETGFQLRAYNLQQTSQLIGDDSVGGGPNYQSSILSDPAKIGTCTEAIYNDPTHPDWTPDCRLFYDADLNEYYRRYAWTITVSDDCHPLRNSIDNVVYNGIPSESSSCPASANLCREYRGPAGFNTQVILSDNFDDGNTLGWSGGTWTTESLIFGGGSMRSLGNSVKSEAPNDVSALLQKGRSYLVSFWAGAASSGNRTLAATINTDAFEGTATLEWDDSDGGHPLWNFYTLGPVHLDRDITINDQLQFTANGSFYIDNIKLTEVSDNVYLIKDTYDICTGNENCDRYTDKDRKVQYLKSFTRLCSEEKVGCEALIDTRNSDSPFSSVYMNGSDYNGQVPRVVQEDSVVLLVNNPDVYCKSEFQGCKFLGAPTLGPSGNACTNDPARKCTQDSDCAAGGSCIFYDTTIEKYDSVYLIDDPDQYDVILCKASEVMCNAWTTTRTGEVVYFRDPTPQTCEYKTVTIGGQAFTGWYKTGTSGLRSTDRCPVVTPAPSALLPNYRPAVPYTQPTGSCSNNPEQQCDVDADCPGANNTCVRWAGICPQEEAGCKEYRDNTDPAGCFSQCLLTLNENDGTPIPVDETCAIDPSSGNQGCRGYWYLQQSVEDDASECNGVVDEELGCKPFFSPDP